jgi:hypothetical protein
VRRLSLSGHGTLPVASHGSRGDIGSVAVRRRTSGSRIGATSATAPAATVYIVRARTTSRVACHRLLDEDLANSLIGGGQ